MIKRRRSTLKSLSDESVQPEWLSTRPTEHQWSIDEILRHMIANEIRYLQMPLDDSIEQHPKVVRAQWVGNILFRLEEDPHVEISELISIFDSIESTSKKLLDSLTSDQLEMPSKAPWGEMLTYRHLISDLLDHEQLHRGQILYLLTFFRGPPAFVDPPTDKDFG